MIKDLPYAVMAHCFKEPAVSCFQEENLVTNFEASELALYEAVVEHYGDNLFITQDAYTMNGHPMTGFYALRCKTPVHKFEIFELVAEIRKKMNAN